MTSIFNRLSIPDRSSMGVVGLLLTQAALLGYSATRHSPTQLEPAFLVSGISHWRFAKFELYRVNPPLVRMVAALPVLAVGCETDWGKYYDAPGSRAEYSIGQDFLKVNGRSSIQLICYARWACIPFALLGGYFAYRWSLELYGKAAGFLTLTLWTFEPNLLAHAELITADCACTSFGIASGYWFWRWLRDPCWCLANLAGLFLGAALLSKLTWCILFVLWPMMWIFWRISQRRSGATKLEQDSTVRNLSEILRSDSPGSHKHIDKSHAQPPLIQLSAILLLALYLLNTGYCFDGTGTKLGEFQFVSRILTGHEQPGHPGNRFANSLIGSVPMPVPQQYLLGLDTQKQDFEESRHPSYLRGEWKQGGWWYYYLYGLLVKVPCGIWGLLSVVCFQKYFGRFTHGCFKDEIVLLTPAIALLLLVSSQTAFNDHLRYIFPSLGILLIFIGQALYPMNKLLSKNILLFRKESLTKRSIIWTVIIIFLPACVVYSSLREYPNHLSYFNEFVGGSDNGYQHLLGSSLDWGQDLLMIADWQSEHQDRVVLYESNGPAMVACKFLNLGLSVGLPPKGVENDQIVVVSSLGGFHAHRFANKALTERIGATHIIRPLEKQTD